MKLTFFILSLITLQFAIVKCGHLEIELVNELFENYNKNIRPVNNVSFVKNERYQSVPGGSNKFIL